MNRVDPRNLSVRDLRDELRELEESWMETLLRGSEDALDDFASRTRELEEEFDRRKRDDEPAVPGETAPERAASDRTPGDEPAASPWKTATREPSSGPAPWGPGGLPGENGT
ncbi:DUF6158 family protein [Sphaerisporangium sp. NBC_01403]|uniref:DUF6158 family protein n=1 Tax=Sphaerisporangium sp. NBC_01403 TaxID=2903599 RepID=UPI00324ED0FE